MTRKNSIESFSSNAGWVGWISLGGRVSFSNGKTIFYMSRLHKQVLNYHHEKIAKKKFKGDSPFAMVARAKIARNNQAGHIQLSCVIPSSKGGRTGYPSSMNKAKPWYNALWHSLSETESCKTIRHGHRNGVFHTTCCTNVIKISIWLLSNVTRSITTVHQCCTVLLSSFGFFDLIW